MTWFFRVFIFFLWVFWLSFIFYLSGIPELRSSLPSWQDFLFRKLAHIGEYAVLFALTFFVFHPKRKKITFVFVILVMLFTFLYAVSDEIHQSFIFGRKGSIYDLGFDIFGIVLGFFFLQRQIRYENKKRKS